MAKIQTRKSISMSKTAYDRLKVYCLGLDRSVASVVEALTISHLDKVEADKAPLFSPAELN